MRFRISIVYKDGEKNVFELLADSVGEAIRKARSLAQIKSPHRFKDGKEDIHYTETQRLD